MRLAQNAFLSVACIAALVACSGTDSSGIAANTVVVNPPGSSLEVRLTLASVTLASDCDTAVASDKSSGDSAVCAAAPDGGTSSCGSLACQQTNMQITVESHGDTRTAKLEVLSARLLESVSLTEVDTLKARDPQSWDGAKYTTWNEAIAPQASSSVSYKLSSPNWSKSTGNNWDSYKTRYVLDVVIKVDGVTRTLRSAELSRAPIVAT